MFLRKIKVAFILKPTTASQKSRPRAEVDICSESEIDSEKSTGIASPAQVISAPSSPTSTIEESILSRSVFRSSKCKFLKIFIVYNCW